jgi:hypothetical protein
MQIATREDARFRFRVKREAGDQGQTCKQPHGEWIQKE